MARLNLAARVALIALCIATLATSEARAADPARDETWIAFSANGYFFGRNRKLFDHASVPSVIAHKGRLLVYFVDFSAATRASESLSVASSDDLGQTWSRPSSVTINGLPPSWKAVDPCATIDASGRVRLYYFASPPPAGAAQNPLWDPAQVEGEHLVLSAVSLDGILFTQEPGVRFRREGLSDPDVVRLPSGQWRMYFAWDIAGSGGAVLSATSEDVDGQSFKEDPGRRHSEAATPGALALPDGRIRLFLSGPGGIISKIGDGLSFQDEGLMAKAIEGEILADPSVVRLQYRTDAPALYVLVYKRKPL